MTDALPRRVLLLGASGFIGARLRAALERAGHHVVCGVRSGNVLPGCSTVDIDFVRDIRPEHWVPRLRTVDVVINAVGIFREAGSATFERIHIEAPAALFQACAQAGVSKVIHISALGADADARSRYHLSKQAGDNALARLETPWVIVQPSLVYAPDGVSAALFSRLAALPFIPVPGDGGQHVQPLHVDDLVEGVARLVTDARYDRTRVAFVGPRPVTLRQFLAALRRSMGLGYARVLPVPLALMNIPARLGEYSERSLLTRESMGMLLRGNVGSSARLESLLGRRPRTVEQLISSDEAVAVANAARLAWLLPLLRVSIGIVWIATAIVSFGVYPVADSYALLERVGLTGGVASVALYGAALLDLAFGVGVFVLRDRRWLWRVQIALIASYSVIIAFFLPEQWLHPFGPMLKNLPMLAAIVFLHEMEGPTRRPT